jgi:hypothetical protein
MNRYEAIIKIAEVGKQHEEDGTAQTNSKT